PGQASACRLAAMIAAALDDWLYRTPLMALALGALVCMLLAALAGMALRGHQDRAGATERHDEQEGYVVTAVLGLLALLMGFTFALAVDRFETRRLLVLEEANAIENAYVYAQMLDEPHRTRLCDLLVRYTDNSLAMARAFDRAANTTSREAN